MEEISSIGRSKLVFCDAYQKQTLDFIDQTFDVIVDDGPHTEHSFYFLVENYSKLLKENGILVIEDIYDYQLIDKMIERVPSGFTYEVFDLRENKGRWDDIVFVIRRK